LIVREDGETAMVKFFVADEAFTMRAIVVL
jgi:hypothetical protein